MSQLRTAFMPSQDVFGIDARKLLAGVVSRDKLLITFQAVQRKYGEVCGVHFKHEVDDAVSNGPACLVSPSVKRE